MILFIYFFIIYSEIITFLFMQISTIIVVRLVRFFLLSCNSYYMFFKVYNNNLFLSQIKIIAQILNLFNNFMETKF